VSNESADIVRMLGAMAGALEGTTAVDLYPKHLRSLIDETNTWVYQGINNAVYRSGFATTQEAYARAQSDLWAAMERAESVLSASRFLCGDRITEADLRLYPTLVRFDAVYATLFKCARHRIATRYPNLLRLMRDLYHLHLSGSPMQVRDTFNCDAARSSYFGQLFPLNPGGIVPDGPGMAGVLGYGSDEDLKRKWEPDPAEVFLLRDPRDSGA